MLWNTVKYFQTGDWKGAGAHTKFSTKKMREDNGIIEIEVRDKMFESPLHNGLVYRELLTNCRVITSDTSKPTILMKEKTTSGD